MSQPNAAVAAPVNQAPTNTASDTASNTANVQQNQTPSKDQSSKAPTGDEYFEVPVDGKVVKMTREQIIKQASLASAANQRFEEAAKMRRQAENVLGRLRDPKQAIALLQDPRLGLDQKQIREAFEDWYSETIIKREQMSPEQQELADAKNRLKKYEEQEASIKRQQEEEENKRLDQDEMQNLQKELIQILETSGLPKSAFTVSRLAHWMRTNAINKLNAPHELLVQQVKKDINDRMREMIQSSDGEVLANLLGEETVKKVRKYDLDRLKAKRNQGQFQPQNPQPNQPNTKPTEKLSKREVQKLLREWK